MCIMRMEMFSEIEYNKCTRREAIQTDHKEVGSRLRKLRGTRDAKSVAKALGISTSALFMYERGERSPRDQVKMKIARYYGLPVQEIFFSE